MKFHPIKRLYAIGFVFLISGSCLGQNKLSVDLIPDSLKKNAYSVVREHHTEFTMQNKTNGDAIYSHTITILNEKGKEEAYFFCYGDKFRDLRKFSGEIYDKNGKLIRKIKKSELKYSEYSSDLASDGKYYYYECYLPSYPITIKYEWEVKNKNGILGFPPFLPQSTYHQSVEKASYRLTLPKEIAFQHKSIRMPEQPEYQEKDKMTTYTWEINGISALEEEPFSPSILSQIPIIWATPIEFSYDGTEGSLKDWNSYGLWQYGLLKERDKLPSSIIEKLKNRTKEMKDDKEKVRAVYELLGETTRYVSIQLGIGGLQPMPAREVCATGFGDCKALTNYAMALLKNLDIPAYYTVIHTRNKKLIPDFASANQMNHVILQVPLPNDTLWLECTNPELPFGYVHESIAGNDALLIKETGGELCRLPTNADSLNCENRKVDLYVMENGTITATVSYEAKQVDYERRYGFTKLPPKEQTDYLRRQIQIPQASVKNISYREEKSEYPVLYINYEIESQQYGSKTGSRLFIPSNAFRKEFNKVTKKERKNDIVLRNGYVENDVLTFHLSDNYTIEALPPSSIYQHECGMFINLVQTEDNKIKVLQTLQMKSGIYSADQYEDFLDFCKKVSETYTSKIILKSN